MAEVGAVGGYDCEGIWEREEVALDEAASGEYLRGEMRVNTSGNDREVGRPPVSFMEWRRPDEGEELK